MFKTRFLKHSLQNVWQYRHRALGSKHNNGKHDCSESEPKFGNQTNSRKRAKKTSRALTQGTSGTSCGKCTRTTVSQVKPRGSLHQIEIENNGKRDCVSLWADCETQIFVITGSHKNWGRVLQDRKMGRRNSKTSPSLEKWYKTTNHFFEKNDIF